MNQLQIHKPLVSIITCTYNSEKYLRECLDSVNSQDYPEIEHVIIDGFSTDNTLDIIKRYDGLKIYRKEPKGISDAMNFGIQKATGHIIAHLHSDDYYYDADVVTRSVNGLLSSDATWSYGKLLLLYPDGTKEFAYSGIYKYSRIFWKSVIYHPTVFIRREVFSQVGMFNTALKYAMDFDLWFRIGKRYSPVFIDAPITCFRKHDDSLSYREYSKTLREGYQVRMRYAKYHPWLMMLITLRYLQRRFLQ